MLHDVPVSVPSRGRCVVSFGCFGDSARRFGILVSSSGNGAFDAITLASNGAGN